MLAIVGNSLLSVSRSVAVVKDSLKFLDLGVGFVVGRRGLSQGSLSVLKLLVEGVVLFLEQVAAFSYNQALVIR